MIWFRFKINTRLGRQYCRIRDRIRQKRPLWTIITGIYPHDFHNSDKCWKCGEPLAGKGKYCRDQL